MLLLYRSMHVGIQLAGHDDRAAGGAKIALVHGSCCTCYDKYLRTLSRHHKTEWENFQSQLLHSEVSHVYSRSNGRPWTCHPSFGGNQAQTFSIHNMPIFPTFSISCSPETLIVPPKKATLQALMILLKYNAISLQPYLASDLQCMPSPAHPACLHMIVCKPFASMGARSVPPHQKPKY